MKIKCAEAFFNQISIDGYKVAFHKQLTNKRIKQVIDGASEWIDASSKR